LTYFFAAIFALSTNEKATFTISCNICVIMAQTVHLLIMYTMLVLTLLLFHKGRKHPQSLMLAIYASVEVLTNGLNSLTLSSGNDFFDRFPFSHFIYKPIYCLWVPLFYFYFRSNLSPDFRITKKHWPHYLPSALFLFSFLFIWVLKGNHYIWENLYNEGSLIYNAAYAVDATVKIQYLIYNFLMIKFLLRYEQDFLLQKQEITSIGADIRWLRFIVYGYALGSLGGILLFVSGLFNSPATSMINILSITYFFLFFFAIFYYTITQKSYTGEVKQKGILPPEDEMKALMDKIEQAILEKKMFLNPELNLQQLGTELNEKERNISQAINAIKKRNVNDYINSLRIEYACQLLVSERNKPIFEIMYESGFSTKGAFNLAFKKITGKTPTQYREEKVVN